MSNQRAADARADLRLACALTFTALAFAGAALLWRAAEWTVR